MAQDTSYPSPNSAQMGAGPFFASQHQLPVTEDVQAPTPLPHRVHPNTPGMEGDGDQTYHTDRNAQELRPTQISSSQQIAQNGLAQSGLGQDGSDNSQNRDHNPGDSSSRKRTKVSRACDECRRKKIRCDPDTSEPRCNNCIRSDSICMFTRTPQKRGPNKGYIKELAERVEVLEARHPIPSVPGYPYAAYNEYSPHPEEPGYGLNKRSSSMSERVQTSPYMQDHQIPGDAIGRYSDQIQAGDAIGRYQVTRGVQGNLVYSSTPHNTTDQQAPMNSPHTPQSFIQQGNHHLTPGDNPAMEVQLNDQMDYPSEWDEYPIDEYYRVVHTTIPLLPDTKTELLRHLAKASDNMREVVLAALQTLAKPASSDAVTHPRVVQHCTKATEILMALQFEDAAMRSPTDNLVYLEALILMALATDVNNPSAFQPPVWYGLAVSMSTFLGLHLKQPYQHGEPNADEKLARRAWLVLMIIDRWHGGGTLSPLLVVDVTLFREDNVLLGDTGYHFARLSLILGHIADTILLYHSKSISHGRASAALNFRILDGQLERFRESVESLFASAPLLHMSYLHAKLLLQRHARVYHLEMDEYVKLVLKTAGTLCTGQTPTSPFIHHYASLSAVALVEHFQIPGLSAAIFPGLQDLRYWLDKESTTANTTHKVDQSSWNWIISNYIALTLQRGHPQRLHGKSAPIGRGSLEHLANAAVGTANVSGEDGGDEVMRDSEDDSTANRASTPKGYLDLVRSKI